MYAETQRLDASAACFVDAVTTAAAKSTPDASTGIDIIRRVCKGAKKLDD
jgi:hypothetical protein